MKNTIPFFTTMLLILGGIQYSTAQFTVNNSLTPAQMAQLLVANNSVTVSNATMNCPSNAGGTFTCATCHLGLSAGVVLTTGNDSLIAGPNNTPNVGRNNGAAGDSDIGTGSRDACSLEFDVLVSGNSIQLDYVFGSEEYPSYVCSPFTDKFVILISGPGLSGKKQMQLVPNTNLPVGIGTINPGTPGVGYSEAGCSSLSYSNYYVANGDGSNAPFNTDANYIQYNGHTTVLTAKQGNLQPNQTYHIKVAIADIDDYIRDSGLFLGAGSLLSTIDSTTSITEPDALMNIKLYPNPTSNVITIDMSNNQDAITNNYSAIEVYNLLGEKQVSYTGGSKVASLNIADLAAGMYTATIVGSNGERRTLGRFVKE
ncbi:MAG: T9SS type A sorting domain-containing protein [Bacteroidetes bacterium]|nr:T9SS type A sorting domain-containing protein [Bacteroidota bacterium]